MPELPEVETVRRGLLPLLGARITRVQLRRRGVLVVPGDPPGGWERSLGPIRRSGTTPPRPRRYHRAMLLEGGTLAGFERRGKRLAFFTADDAWALDAHLGMTGAFLVLAPGQRCPAAALAHAHASWWFEDARRLVFSDPRRFGGLRAFPGRDSLVEAAWSPLGPDALGVTGADLSARAGGARRPVKAALLDQRVVAGVGNIYADEACFAARLRPGRVAATLVPAEWDRLAACIRCVLADAIAAGGSSIRDFAHPDGQSGAYQRGHAVYGRAGEACLACRATLQSGTLAQRTTVWCPVCQPGATTG